MARLNMNYNGTACVQYRIRLMAYFYVEYSGSACVKDMICLFGAFARHSQNFRLN